MAERGGRREADAAKQRRDRRAGRRVAERAGTLEDGGRKADGSGQVSRVERGGKPSSRCTGEEQGREAELAAPLLVAAPTGSKGDCWARTAKTKRKEGRERQQARRRKEEGRTLRAERRRRVADGRPVCRDSRVANKTRGKRAREGQSEERTEKSKRDNIDE
jgi:hypothetical protein